MERLIAQAAERGHAVYFLGAEAHVVSRMVERLRERFPGLRIAGFRDGFWRPEEEAAVVEAVRASGADLLFLALGSPRKEEWLHQHKSALQVPVLMGVGGSFDVVAGFAKVEPRWIREAGFAWLYRLVQEPRRLWRRYADTNPAFVRLFVTAWVRRQLTRGSTR
jgi:N-acetylglucosaminyldiphosphoundecaprenol N-acetyl-beta-D-mannosaminyltransferase